MSDTTESCPTRSAGHEAWPAKNSRPQLRISLADMLAWMLRTGSHSLLHRTLRAVASLLTLIVSFRRLPRRTTVTPIHLMWRSFGKVRVGGRVAKSNRLWCALLPVKGGLSPVSSDLQWLFVETAAASWSRPIPCRAAQSSMRLNESSIPNCEALAPFQS